MSKPTVRTEGPVAGRCGSSGRARGPVVAAVLLATIGVALPAAALASAAPAGAVSRTAPRLTTVAVPATWQQGSAVVDPDTATCGQWYTTTAPAGAVSAEVSVSGAGGGGAGHENNHGDPTGGSGALVTATLTGAALTSPLSVELGCGGGPGLGDVLGITKLPTAGAGFGGGGGGGGPALALNFSSTGGGGGGGSALCLGSGTCTKPVVVAGAGGGGGGELDCSFSDSGGSGGSGGGGSTVTASGVEIASGTNGSDGDDGKGGGAGSASGGGAGGAGTGPNHNEYSGSGSSSPWASSGGGGGVNGDSSLPYDLSGGGGGGGGYNGGGGGGADDCLDGNNAAGGGGAGASAVLLADAAAPSFANGSPGGLGNTTDTATSTVDCPDDGNAQLTTGCPGSVTLTWQVNPQPTVTSVAPAAGPTAGGTSVVIEGTNLSDAQSVSFGGLPATSVSQNSATSLTAVAPAAADTTSDSTVDVTVTTSDGTSATTSADRFTYDVPPVVTFVAPAQGRQPGSTEVHIVGGPFTGTTAVDFGTTPATGLDVVAPDDLMATSPAGSGTVDITVTTPGGTSPTGPADAFTYEAPPTVSLVEPSEGQTSGGPVEITGTGFDGAVTGVFFGESLAASFTLLPNGTIDAVAPPAGAGTVDVTVQTPYGTSPVTSADHYTYVADPTVTGVAPNTGPASGGTQVTVTGTGFTSPATVLFGNLDATDVVVQSPTELTADAPPGAGTVDVEVATFDGRSAATPADQFTYGAAPSPPAVTGLNPADGSSSGGTSVQISGSGFSGAQAVYFGDMGATYTVISPTEIIATTPPGSGAVNVSVLTSGGLSPPSAGSSYRYLGVPTVTGLDQRFGSQAGGTSVTVTGTGFTDATSVSFGSTAATDLVVVSDTELTVDAPTGTGTVDVTVTTPGGTSVQGSADQFTYLGRPVVTSAEPSSGPTAGGTVVAIVGSGFQDVVGVDFGSTAGSVDTIDPRLIEAVAPPGTGTVDITVTTAGGTSATTASDQFTYLPAPTVTSLSQVTGPQAGGGAVTIEGTGFTGATGVAFGTVTASYTVVSDTELTATIPPGAGTVEVSVTTPGGVSADSGSSQYAYLPVPAVASVSPSSGATSGGNSVTITGSGFSGLTWVSFNGHIATDVTQLSTTELTATAPAGSGTVDVSIYTAGGFSSPTAGDRYTYVAPTTHGYWMVAADGGVFSFGDAGYAGSMGGQHLNAPIVGIAPTADGLGYWMVAADGGVFSFGDAGYAGSMGGQHLNAPIVGIAPTADGLGYWLVAADGGVFSFGDAAYAGSMGGQHLNAPIVGMTATADGLGYWLVAADGGVFSFGDATYAGSMGGQHLNAPIVGIAPTSDGLGYWMVAADGGVFSFGDATYAGSMGGQHLNQPIVGIAPTSDGLGYWMVAADGGVFSFGDAAYLGSMGGQHLNAPIVGMSGSPEGRSPF